MDSDSSSRTVQLTVESGAWETSLADIAGLCSRAVGATLAGQAPALAHRAEVSVLLTDDPAIRALNRSWRGHDKPTNVLSFPVQDDVDRADGEMPLLLGDLVLGYDTVLREARAESKPLADHVTHLLVHGTLHLLGLDHATEEEAEAMEGREVAILATLGVPDPYRAEERA